MEMKVLLLKQRFALVTVLFYSITYLHYVMQK